MVCGDGDYDALALVELAERAGWPVLAEPSSGGRRGPNALSAYQYLLATPEFVRAHQPDLIVSAGRPGLSRAQIAFLGAGLGGCGWAASAGAGTWSSRRDPGAGPTRSAPPPTSRQALRLTGTPGGYGAGWMAGSGRMRRRAARWTPCSTATRT